MTIIIATDKFKGSLSSLDAGRAIERGLNKKNPSARAIIFPMADGGDGFATVLKHYCHTETIDCTSLDPLQRPIRASYEWDAGNKTAIIELAAASGLVLLKESERNPLNASTEGTGLLIKDAIERGASRILLGLGGSATNDAGTGILQALGFIFLNEHGLQISASGESLNEIRQIIAPSVLPDVQFNIACDVQNVLYGPQGAAFVYAPQKGADENAVIQLDNGLKNFSAIIHAQTGRDIATAAGTGAAGGIAAGLMGFFPVKIESGIGLMIGMSGIKKLLSQADLLITGEGRLDAQSIQGKVVGEIAALAKAYGIPCIAICGSLELDEAATRTLGLRKIIALNDGTVGLEELMRRASFYLEEKIAGIEIG